jgi:hypothetical protein
MWTVLHVEHYARYDSDDDGVAELHRVRTIGESFDTILSDEIVPEVPFAVGSPVRIPHALIGLSIMDQTADLQDIKTEIMRGTLDSLAQAVRPSVGVVENAVNIDDVLNNEAGRVIRMKMPGAVQPFAEPFVGPAALGTLEYLDRVRAERTGISPQSTQLDSKAMQSTTRVAVENTVERSQERVELIARVLAETLLRDTFRGVLREVIRNQDKPATVRLRGKWVTVDPRDWDMDADVTVDPGLGRGTDQQRMEFLGTIAQRQEAILTQFGPGNPMVAPSQLRATYAEMMRLGGFKNADKFFKPITPEQDAMMAKAAAEAPKPKDPAMILAEVEQMKARTEADIATQKAQLDLLKAQAEDDRERDRMVAEFMIKAAEIQAKYGAQVDLAMIKASIDREKSVFQLEQQRRSDEMAHEREREKSIISTASAEAVQRERIASGERIGQERVAAGERMAKARGGDKPARAVN